MRKTSLLVIHCSATPPSMQIGVKEIDRWHRDRGWSGIGYHLVIRRSGKVETGRPLSRQGAHARGFNRHSIGICLVGGVDADMEPADNFTRKQYQALVRLVSRLRDEHDIVSVVGHRDLPGVRKACPSMDTLQWVYDHF